jgi:hypothetical protein
LTCGNPLNYFKYNNDSDQTYGSPGQCTSKKLIDSPCGSHSECNNRAGLQCTEIGCQCKNPLFAWNTWFLQCSLIPCEKGWKENCTKCIKEITTIASTIQEARDACKNYDPDSRLLTIKSDQNIAYLGENYGGNPLVSYWVIII